MIFENKKFLNPDNKYRMNLMQHSWDKETKKLFIEAIKAYGYGGVVTNPNFTKGEVLSEEILKDFSDTLERLDENNLEYWIYDENGYPSGLAGGITLKDHREYEAKGFYMVRRVAYEGGARHSVFHIDDETDKIVWAAKYPLDVSDMQNSYVEYEKMISVPFTKTSCECDLNENEVLFIFCVKAAYEGSASTHNTSSFLRYINILDEKAVKRFIDVAYEPIVKNVSDAYKRARAVFTDEPALQTTYFKEYEMWPYALAPYVDGIFEMFENEYGYSLLKYLPMIFEGRPNAYPVRVHFYHLVGKIIGKAFVKQISDWLKKHDGVFSGHYLGEETMEMHVSFFGDFIEMLKQTGYPGIDALWCYPEIYDYNTAKFAQIVARKNNTNGMMVEFCPFINKEVFEKTPMDNMMAIINVLFLSGVRKVNSYYKSDFSKYSDKLPEFIGGFDLEQSNKINDYIGRLGYMLDNLSNDCNLFVYYPIEDVQAKFVPCHGIIGGDIKKTDFNTNRIIKKIYESGYDFYYADKEDLVNAMNSMQNGKPEISGNEVKTVIIPSIDVMYDESVEALIKLKQAGVQVLFVDDLPSYGTSFDNKTTENINEYFYPVSLDDAVLHLKNIEEDFNITYDNAVILKAKFIKDGHEMYFVTNYTRGIDTSVSFKHKNFDFAKIYNPEDGSVSDIKMGEKYTISSFRSVFVLFE